VPTAGFAREYGLSGLKPGQAAVVSMGTRLADFKVGLNQVRGQARGAEAAE
jgi:hypothetical protein